VPDLSHPARVAALRVLKDRVTAEYDAARVDAESHFKALATDMGVKSLEARMPSGEPAGTVAIKGARRKITWSGTALVDLVERAAPQELIEEIDPDALQDAALLELLKEARPDLIRKRVQPAYLKKVSEQVSDDGTLADQSTGEVVKVADISHTPVTGEFSYTPSARAEEAVLEAWHRGELAGVGESLVPAAELGSAAQPLPEGGRS
jgi:hypothetical protein